MTGGEKQPPTKRKEFTMKLKLAKQPTMFAALASALVLASGTPLIADGFTPPNAKGSVTMELIGQALVLSPQAAIQYGYLSHLAGVETIFSGAPQNESTAIFTFYNDTATTRVINNGPVRIVNREGTATIYLNATPGADFANPDSFRAGVPVMTASLRHQVLFDTVQNTFITQFDLTITSVEHFKVDGQDQRLGNPGQKLTWIVYGRPNTVGAAFVIAGFGLSDRLVKQELPPEHN